LLLAGFLAVTLGSARGQSSKSSQTPIKQDSEQQNAKVQAQPAAGAQAGSAPALGAQAAASGEPGAAASSAIPVPAPADAGGDKARQAINDDCANLFKMATELKAAAEKSTIDELSAAVVQKANQIEQLAHHVRDEMKPAAGKD
jgi:hypothetical protein